MKTVTSKELGVSITGNMITYHNIERANIPWFIADFEQVTLVRTVADGVFSKYDVSFPMTKDHHSEFAGLIHRLNSENKLGKQLKPKEKGPDDDGPPPVGGTPSAANQVVFEETLAIAA